MFVEAGVRISGYLLNGIVYYNYTSPMVLSQNPCNHTYRQALKALMRDRLFQPRAYREQSYLMQCYFAIFDPKGLGHLQRSFVFVYSWGGGTQSVPCPRLFYFRLSAERAKSIYKILNS